MDGDGSALVTHYFPEQPRKGFWIELSYFCAVTRDGVRTYVRGSAGRQPYGAEVLQALAKSGQLCILSPGVELSPEQSLFLTPTGEVFLAETSLGIDDPRKRVVDVVPGRAFLPGSPTFEDFGIEGGSVARLSAEFRDAGFRLLAKAEKEGLRRVKELADVKRFVVISCPIPGLGAGFDMHQKMEAVLKGMPQLGAFEHSRPDEVFEAIINEVTLQNQRSIFLFPYFHSPIRRRTWGVIPYARQRELGVLIHKDHDAVRVCDEYSTLAEILRRKKPRVSELGMAVRKWLAKVVIETKHMEGTIVAFHGYIFGEVLSLLVEEAGDPNALSGLDRLRHVSKYSNEYVPASVFSKKGARGVVHVFDPLEIDLVNERLIRRQHGRRRETGQHIILSLPHGLDIPVGIGFTLPMFPSLVKDEAWSKLLESVRPVLASHFEEFRGRGIDLSEFVGGGVEAKHNMEEQAAAGQISRAVPASKKRRT